MIALVAAAFTVISAGIGLIQARFAVLAIEYSNLKNIPDPTGLVQANIRLEQQSALYLPLGMFLVTLGLAMLFSTVLRVGLSFFDQEPVKKGWKDRCASLGRLLGCKNIVQLAIAFGLMAGAYWFVPRVHLAVDNVVGTVYSHQSFPIGFIVMAMIFWVLLDTALKERP